MAFRLADRNANARSGWSSRGSQSMPWNTLIVREQLVAAQAVTWIFPQDKFEYVAILRVQVGDR